MICYFAVWIPFVKYIILPNRQCVALGGYMKMLVPQAEYKIVHCLLLYPNGRTSHEYSISNN